MPAEKKKGRGRVTAKRLENLADLAECSIVSKAGAIKVAPYRGAWEETFARPSEAAAFLKGVVRGRSAR